MIITIKGFESAASFPISSQLGAKAVDMRLGEISKVPDYKLNKSHCNYYSSKDLNKTVEMFYNSSAQSFR